MSSFRLPVGEMVGRPGAYKDFERSETIEGVAVGLARLVDWPVRARLRAEGVVEGILVTGELAARVRFSCARCLQQRDGEVEPEVCELFAAPGHLPADGEDVYEIVGGEIDLEPMVRDALTLALPLNPLCRPDCRGLCPSCGRDLNRSGGACDCRDEELDPRWASLDEVRAQLTELRRS